MSSLYRIDDDGTLHVFNIVRETKRFIFCDGPVNQHTCGAGRFPDRLSRLDDDPYLGVCRTEADVQERYDYLIFSAEQDHVFSSRDMQRDAVQRMKDAKAKAFKRLGWTPAS